MPIKIMVDVITKTGKHTIILPQSQNTFDNTLNKTKIFNGEWNEYKINRVESKFEGLDRSLAFAQDIEEINFLAQLLSGFSEKEMQIYENFVSSFLNISTMQYLINVAYSFLGINGGLYDDKFFPEYDYETEYFMKVKLSLPNQSRGVYVFLPANQSVIDRALHRLGVKYLDECIVSQCACGTFHSIKQVVSPNKQVPQLIKLIYKVAKIPHNQIDNYLEMVVSKIDDENIDRLIELTDRYLVAN
jgi:hypothetical protein